MDWEGLEKGLDGVGKSLPAAQHEMLSVSFTEDTGILVNRLDLRKLLAQETLNPNPHAQVIMSQEILDHLDHYVHLNA